MSEQVPKEKKVEMSPRERLWRALQALGGDNWPHGNDAAKAIDDLIKQRIEEAQEKRS